MYKGKQIAVVVPAYNEQEFVGDVIETVPEFVDRVYPVDDCSTDDTWNEIRAAARARERADGGTEVVPIQHGTNQGVGAAIKTGYRRAVRDGADVIAVMNGDGQMDPDILDRIIDPVVEDVADYAKGNRLLSPDHWEGMSAWRLFGNHLLTLLTRIASGYWRMTDPQNGYTAISAAAIEQLDLAELYDGYGFLNDLLVRLNAHDMRIADVEMQAVYGEESSSIRYSRFVPQLSWLLLWTFVWRLERKYVVDGFEPLVVPYIGGVVGSILLLLSVPFVVLGWGTVEDYTVAVLAFTVCLLLVVVGMLFDRHHNTRLETRVRK